MKITTFMIIGCIAGALVAEASTVLYEDFELSNGITTGSIEGQNGWTVNTGSGSVQTSVVESGAQALEIVNGSVSKGISTNGSTLWMHFQARIAAAPQTDPVFDPTGTVAAFYVNTSLNLVVYSNGVPTELSTQMPLNAWTRFDIYCDNVAGIWNLAMNGVNVASGLPLESTNAAERVMFSNLSTSSSFLDSLDIADTEQVGAGMPDTDSDGVPDWWEQKYFGDVVGCVANATSGNGDLTYKQTYIAALNPFAYDPLLVALDENGVVRWNPKESRLYDVEWTSNLKSNFVAIASDMDWAVDSYPVSTVDDEGFYRVNVHL